MTVHNDDISDVLERVADLLEIQGANAFRVRAYRNAARNVASCARTVAEMNREEVDALPGIGADLAEKIVHIGATGDLPLVHELEAQTPSGLVELLRLPGLGPKRVELLWEKLGVRSLADLERAAAEGRVAELRGFGEKTQARILEGARALAATGGARRVTWRRAHDVARALEAWLAPAAERVVVAGSYRRRKDTVGDLDVLATGPDPAAIAERFFAFDEIAEPLARGPTRVAARLRSGLQVDVRVVPAEGFGAALHYFTGSKAHNIAVRRRGVERGLKINEYGVFRDGERVGGATEEEVFAAVGLRAVPPELREDRGEIEAAASGDLPRLVTLADLRGDLHVHSVVTDGRDTLREMVRAAKERGHAYVASTEHSRSLYMTRGLDADALRDHLRLVRRVEREIGGIRVLRGIECDILEDGTLDLPDDALAELDWVLVALHAPARQTPEQRTERILRALDNRHVHALAHPTGRIIGQRAPYAFDVERVVRGAAERGVALEVDGQPDRMDLDDTGCRMAREAGAKVVISSDAHSVDELGYLELGVAQARRGWLGPDDVLNTRPWAELERLIRR